MCCFTGLAAPVGFFARLFGSKPLHVSATNLYARMTAPGVQALAYGMSLDTATPVAMVLPLPVAPGSGEDAVRFVSLDGHARMFGELDDLFTPPMLASRALPAKGGFLPRPQTLVVHEVGAFVASYVPTRADFARLDPRFRIGDVLFDAVPAYADHGFAVFQLDAGKTTVHPMAFTFPTRAPDRLFFPTVHLHGPRFEPRAGFDHALYFQHPRYVEPTTTIPGDFEGYEASWLKPNKDYAGLVDQARPMLRRQLRGKLPNVDTWVALA